MHSKTMEIKEFDSEEEAKNKGFYIPLTHQQAKMLGEINRAQRRKWALSEGYFAPEEHNRWQANRNYKKLSRKRVKKATLKMQRKARALCK
jgi:hypothetical protein